ncbi:FGGY-family carbohydrate kinase [Coraliomargarita sp. SDUM461004]|uniref:FGGY-family carbohydrate kinase n=1 Tax=Thalassobacterium sedimentorum TaxID=3041258 RepID=A0ABU1AI87_9BACT|nr:FGGY-family carbohydrate kinase [Coraliomargarita sp. SDUM461004]MDQ8194531.1 FGGY-family carbohydrate kinase [Coraliomargarita sp. SDUM461004]
MNYFIGIDVGTGSARAGLFDQNGQLLANHSRAIQTWKPQPNFVEQSSADIWESICICTQAVIKDAGIHPAAIKGLGFDATCSLVLVGANGQPVTVSPDGDDAQNVIVWMDHRALAETEFINHSCKSPVFDFVGGQISPEMQTPKLLWLKKHLPESWERTAHFFDLPDYLTFRATGVDTRSLCSTTCKWTYLAHEAAAGKSGWQDDFFNAIGLDELVTENYTRLGNDIQPMGQPIGQGLSEQAAQELGLEPSTAVGVSIIDAHAGGIGMIGMPDQKEGPTPQSLDNRLALIGGTSSCHMVASPEQRPISGVWGPYYSSMIPGLWLNEGGQSATGALIDHIIFNHGATESLIKASKEDGCTPYEVLNHKLQELADGEPLYSLTRNLHVCPYFHGNRSPRANPHLVGMISGLHLSASLDDLARLYLATIQAIAYGTRHIIEAMNAAGYNIDSIVCCGGGTKNPIFLQQHADITQCKIILPEEPEAVILGSAMLGAVAAGHYKDVQEAMAGMSRPGQTMHPHTDAQSYHNSKYRVFHKLYEDQIAYQDIMS